MRGSSLVYGSTITKMPTEPWDYELDWGTYITDVAMPPCSKVRSYAPSERTIQRRIERFGAEGMEGLFAAEAAHKRRLQPNIRRLIVDLKAEYPAFDRRVHAVLGSVDIFSYSLRSSSSGVGF
jgi:hypothetical protein